MTESYMLPSGIARPIVDPNTPRRCTWVPGSAPFPGVALGCQARIRDLTTSTSPEQPSPSSAGRPDETC